MVPCKGKETLREVGEVQNLDQKLMSAGFKDANRYL